MSKAIRTLTILIAGAAVLTVLAGCGLGTSGSNAFAPSVTETVALKGLGHGGQQPISGATVQLYAVGNTGYGSAATSLNALNASSQPVTTDANGNFSISSFTCTSPCTASSMVYITLSGGNPGLTAGTNNTASLLLSALGTESNVHNISFIWMNEITTAAAVYALAPFYGADAYHIGSSATNATGISNAFTTAQQLANIGTGLPGGPSLPSGATVSSDSLLAIADILATCVNSTGPGSPGCSSLFSATGGSDITYAAMSMARNPATNVGTLWGLVPGTGARVFNTALSNVPNDWSLSINYSGSMSTPSSPAVDVNGNVWMVNSGNSSVTRLTPSGAPNTLTLGSTPNALALDSSGNAWVAAGTTSGNSTLYGVNGSVSLASTCTGNGLNVPKGITVDTANDLWLINSNSTLSGFYNTCSGSTSSGFIGNFSGAGLTTPVGIVASVH
jgi:hypothetical protein